MIGKILLIIVLMISKNLLIIDLQFVVKPLYNLTLLKFKGKK